MVLEAADLQGLLLIRDSLAMDGAFLLLHVVKLAVQQGCDVVLVYTKSLQGHYAHALRKAGLNHTSLMAAGRLRVVDALAHLAPGSDGPVMDLRSLQLEVLAAARAGGAASAAQSPQVLVAVDDLPVSLAGTASHASCSARLLLAGTCGS